MIDNPPPWPSSARCAVAFTWDMDADSILHLNHPERAGTLLSTQSSLRYGPEVAIPRICSVYREFGLKQTFFVPGWCMERYPRAIEQLLLDGHEIGHHGYIHENPQLESREKECYWLHRALECFDKYVGHRPKGWRGPLNGFSKHSIDLLLEADFQYDSSLMGDDVPYILSNGQGQLVEIPIYMSTDDWPHFMNSWDLKYEMPISSPRTAKEVYLADFDAMWEHRGLWIGVWHPFLSGRPARVRMMVEMIKYMHERGGVWFATLSQINDHLRRCINEGTWQPRIERLPYDPEPIPEVRHLLDSTR